MKKKHTKPYQTIPNLTAISINNATLTAVMPFSEDRDCKPFSACFFFKASLTLKINQVDNIWFVGATAITHLQCSAVDQRPQTTCSILAVICCRPSPNKLRTNRCFIILRSFIWNFPGAGDPDNLHMTIKQFSGTISAGPCAAPRSTEKIWCNRGGEQ